MPPNATRYRLQCFHNYEYHDETFDTLPDLVYKWGDALQLTRRKLDRIRRRQLHGVTLERYRHIIVTDIEPEKKSAPETVHIHKGECVLNEVQNSST